LLTTLVFSGGGSERGGCNEELVDGFELSLTRQPGGAGDGAITGMDARTPVGAEAAGDFGVDYEPTDFPLGDVVGWRRLAILQEHEELPPPRLDRPSQFAPRVVRRWQSYERVQAPLGAGVVMAQRGVVECFSSSADPLLSGWFLLDGLHGADSTRVRAFGDVIGHEMRSNTVRHENSVFHDLLKQVPWGEFHRLVAAHGFDARVSRLPIKSQLILLFCGQFSGASSLREIEAGPESHALRFYHLGAKPPRRSTLADANALRPAALFADLFTRLAHRAHRGLRQRPEQTTYLIDATGVRLCGAAAEWARFSAKASGVKVHVIYDAAFDRPIYALVTRRAVNDITGAQAMPIAAGATHVLDWGYSDYGWWATLDAAGCRIVTRLKSNTPLACVAELAAPEDGPILSDRIGHLPARLGNNRNNLFADPARELRVRIETGSRSTSPACSVSRASFSRFLSHYRYGGVIHTPPSDSCH